MTFMKFILNYFFSMIANLGYKMLSMSISYIDLTMAFRQHFQPHQLFPGEKSPRRFFRWFWDFLKKEKVLPVFLHKNLILNCFPKCNRHFQSVSTDLLSFNCRKYQQNAPYTTVVLLKLNFSKLNTSKATLLT